VYQPGKSYWPKQQNAAKQHHGCIGFRTGFPAHPVPSFGFSVGNVGNSSEQLGSSVLLLNEFIGHVKKRPSSELVEVEVSFVFELLQFFGEDVRLDVFVFVVPEP
jgi:hypothetical protein